MTSFEPIVSSEEMDSSETDRSRSIRGTTTAMQVRTENQSPQLSDSVSLSTPDARIPRVEDQPSVLQSVDNQSPETLSQFLRSSSQPGSPSVPSNPFAGPSSSAQGPTLGMHQTM